ncbi:hypothetical protein ACTQ49_05405 [Luteococcus sp. Sow4_B9]|uniref:hypothetical protein n=1 Tax=Luteococcus sp. Sow4_B9 TaxID=3438792 RepID=UPI003F9861B6
MSGEMSGRQLARLIRDLPEHCPISDAYEAAHLPGDRWWSSQRQHLSAWFNELSGPRAFGRQSRGTPARLGYNRFQCAPGLLWLAEALGEDPAVVQAAADAAGGQGRPATQCAAIRRVIPWQRIEQLLEPRLDARHISRSQARKRIRAARP